MTAEQSGEEAPLTKAEATALAKAGDERWKQQTEELRTRRKTMASELLQFHFDVGHFILSVIEDKERDPKQRLYGSHTVDDASESLGMSPSSIHSCLKFARKVDTKELELLKKAEYPWRAVSSLITVEDAQAYKELKEKYEKGAFQNSDQLKDAVKEANAKNRKTTGKPPNTGGNSSAASQVKSCNTLLNQATAKVIPGFMRAVTDFVKKGDTMSESTVEAIKAGIKDAKKNIRAAQTLLEKADKLIKDSGV